MDARTATNGHARKTKQKPAPETPARRKPRQLSYRAIAAVSIYLAPKLTAKPGDTVAYVDDCSDAKVAETVTEICGESVSEHNVTSIRRAAFGNLFVEAPTKEGKRGTRARLEAQVAQLEDRLLMLEARLSSAEDKLVFVGGEH